MFRNNKGKRHNFLLFAVILIATFLLTGGVKNKVGTAYKKLKLFAEVLSLVETSYVEEIEPNKLVERAIQGMLKNLDPHSSYLPPDSFKEMKVETEGEFGGLGIEITVQNNILTVVSPIEGTPAYRIGIKAKDMIMKTNNESTRDLSLMEAVKKLRGPVNTKVTITIIREGLKKAKDYTLTRAIIKIKSVWSRGMENNIGYVRVRNFSKTTSMEVKEALEKLSKQAPLKGLLLDLRNNPGGLLNQAVEVSNLFLRKGDLIVYTEGRTPDQNMKFLAQKGGQFMHLPTVVLVNGGSASASEIVAGALKDLKRGVILGTKTFGKGSVQTIIPLSDGSGLRLTTAKYFTPSGKVIHGKGIIPDIVVENPDITHTKKEEERDLSIHIFGEKDEVSKKNKTENEKPSDNSEPKDPKEAQFLKAYKDDIQLQRAVDLLKGVDIFQNIFLKKAS